MLLSLRRLKRSRPGEPGPVENLDDAGLLRRFADSRDETAFELLVERHGPMVLAVCRRLLGPTPDADDAFQAAFLVLVRKAGSIRNPAALAGWLYRVAYRIALELRMQRQRRRSREMPAGFEPAVAAAEPHDDLDALLDEEVNRLPERFRQVVVLCYLQGRSTEEAAGRLGVPRGTVLSRLASARDRLRRRLLRRGVTSAAIVATLAGLAQAGVAELPAPALVETTLRGTTALLAGNLGAISPVVLSLTQGVLRAMFILKLKLWAVVVLLAGSALAAACCLLPGAERGEHPPAQAERKQPEHAPELAAAVEPPGPGQPIKETEPPLPKVQIRGGAAGPENLDTAVQWLRGNQLQQLLAIASLSKAEVHKPRQAEVARELEKLLNGNDRLVALESTKALYVWATEEQVPSLLKAIDDTNVFVRRGAIETLGPLQDKRAVEPVAKFLPSFHERQVAGRSLIRMGPIVEEEVRKYLTHKDNGARDEAARVLRQIGKTGKDDEFSSALGGLKDSNVFGRRKALQWFAGADPDHPRRAEAAREIGRLLKDGGPFDKQDAAKALAVWATTKEAPALIATLGQERLPLGVKPEIIRALGRLKDERAAGVLAEMLADPFDNHETVAALTALGPLVETEMLKYLDHERYWARAAACKVLREVGTAKSLPALEETRAKAQREMYGGFRDVTEAARVAIDTIKSRM